MNVVPLRAACSTGLVLIALSALPSAAPAAMGGPGPGVTPYKPGVSPYKAVRGPSASVPGGLGVQVTGREGGVPASVRGSSSSSVSERAVAPAHAPQPLKTFDWADASVGAGVTAGIGLLVAAGAWVFSRRRVSQQLPAA